MNQVRKRVSVASAGGSWIKRMGSQRVVLATCLIGFAILAAAILSTPYLGDDGINKGIRASGQSFWDFVLHYTALWIDVNGRFFPGSVSWTYILFYVFDSRIEYKLVLVVILAIAAAACIALSWAVARNRAAAALVAIALGATLQLRVWYDGLDSFAGLLPLTIALTLGACVIVIRRSGAWWGVAAGGAYLFALFTYETVLLFAPVMVAVVVFVTRSWLRTLPIIVPAVIEIAIVLVLRSGVGSDTGPAYTISLEPLTVARTFGKQFLAALPMSQWWLGYDGAPDIAIPLIILCVALIGVPVYLSTCILGRRTIRLPRNAAPMLGLLGAWMWVSSSALIAVTFRWQQELPLGQGYLAVVYGYFGVALCITALWLMASSHFTRVEHAGSWKSTLWLHGSATGAAALCTLTAAGNLSIAGSYWLQI